LADAINAALAAALPDERWVTKQLQASNDFCLKLQEQLAAEREKWKSGAEGAIRALREHHSEQLAAEREKIKTLGEALRQIATIEANDPEEVAAGLRQTQSYQIATNALAKIEPPPLHTKD
jgi:hypothetical protein